MKFMKRISLMLVVSLFANCTFCSSADAHFLFVYSAEGKVKVVFGEGPEPDQAKFLPGLEDMKSFTTVDGTTKSVELKKVVENDDGWFELPENSVGETVDITCAYGVFARGDKSMFLDYSAKYVRHHAASQPIKPSHELALDLVPEFVAGQLKLTAYFQGLPLSNAEVDLVQVETESLKTTTNDTGTILLSPAKRFLIRAKHVVQEDGESEGKKFSERRYYCTLVLDVGGPSDSTSRSSAIGPMKMPNAPVFLKEVDARLADFPRGMTSFGATVVDDQVYVIGGKAGKAHSYATSYQNRDVLCLNLTNEKSEWKSVGDNLGLQGLAIVGHNGKVYRIGGLEAKNKEGEDHNLHSVAHFLEFNPVDKSWKQMPNLPEGRSSLDACVVDGKVYVVGGWKMDGEEETEWARDMLMFDLADKSGQWQRIATPFTTRALAVGVHGAKLIAVGGIEQNNGPTSSVHFFDLITQQWSVGPEIPTQGNMKAFGCAAVSLDENFMVSTYDGEVFRLSDDAKNWQLVHRLNNGRFFHQMLPIGSSRFALFGGSHMEQGPQLKVKVFEVVSKN